MSTFQRLALWTTATTYLLILVGGLVRASGAGLGCPDWPRCFGSWIPPLSAAELPAGFDRSQFNPVLMWTEYLNRLLGVSVGFLIFATLIVAFRHHRRTPKIVWPTVAAFILVGFEGWLGGVVVKEELTAWLVTAHLVVALVIVSLLLYATLYAFYGPDGGAGTVAGAARTPRRALQWSVGAIIAVTLVQVILGAQVRERVDEALARGVDRSGVLATVGTVDTGHRQAALIVFGGLLVLLLHVWSRYPTETTLTRIVYVIVGLAAGQIGLGLVMAYVRLTPAAQIAHLSVASLLLGAESVLLLLARWLPARED